MPIVFTAITPSTPEFLSELTADESRQSVTVRAMKELEGELYFMKPDTLLVLSEYGSEVPELMNVSVSGQMKLGDSQQVCVCDIELATDLKEAIDTNQHAVPMTIVAPSTVPPEVATPLQFLMAHLLDSKVVSISTSSLSLEDHVAFGRFLHHELLQSNKRVAIIVVGHFGVAGTVGPDARSFQALALRALADTKPADVLALNPELTRASQTDVLHPLAVLVGVLETLNVRGTVLSQAEAHGVMNAVVNFVIQ